MAERIDKAQFDLKINEGDQLKLIEFYSDSCIPCKRLAPLLAEIEEKSPELYVGKVNAAYEKELAAERQVTSTPTLLLFKGGQEKARITGAIKRRQLEELIEKNQD